ncbi:MAG: ribosome silencing factor, partial [Phycisphaerae bacterium]|nr:ribosome silencing factor [Phycisphaerae bacterium]
MTKAIDKTSHDARQWAIEVARLAEDRNCEDILALDLRQASPVTEYFVIASGSSSRLLKSLADELERLGKKKAHKVWRVAGRDAGDWIVMDFVDVVVHLFTQP